MTANERIKQIRSHRRLTSGELAAKAGVSKAEISLIERQMRSPKTDTLQKVAAALEVSTSYLLSELNADLPLEEALARESLQIYLREAKPARDGGAEGEFITNLRHRQLIQQSLDSLAKARRAAAEHAHHEMLLLDLYDALHALDTLTGTTCADDVLGVIFSTFCVGK